MPLRKNRHPFLGKQLHFQLFYDGERDACRRAGVDDGAELGAVSGGDDGAWGVGN